jgi:bacteriocin-like protein
MDNIQMTDRNPSDLGIMEEVEELTSEELLDEELTDEELQAIDGGGIGAVRGAITGGGSSIMNDTFSSRPINWRAAGASALTSAAVGGVLGIAGGPLGAGLAGED